MNTQPTTEGNSKTTQAASTDKRPQTLVQEILQKVEAERKVNQAKQEVAAKRNKKKWDAAHAAETRRANRIIAKIKEAILAPDRSTFKRVMSLEKAEVAVAPGLTLRYISAYANRQRMAFNGLQPSPNADALQQVVQFCRANRVTFEILASYLAIDFLDYRDQLRETAEPDSFCLRVAFF
ncbi:hypothetical protein BH11CYA1_BH11CYA1_27460 [soil metagenome]